MISYLKYLVIVNFIINITHELLHSLFVMYKNTVYFIDHWHLIFSLVNGYYILLYYYNLYKIHFKEIFYFIIENVFKIFE